ncbi:hypothetical protein GCM10027053_12320 [Intrasporangium mesophilum]
MQQVSGPNTRAGTTDGCLPSPMPFTEVRATRRRHREASRYGVAVRPDRSAAYVADYFSSTVSVLSLVTDPDR